MDASTTNLHPDFGPDEGGYPYGIPWTVVNPKTQAFIHLSFEYADESDRGPYPFGPTTPIEGGLNASGDRHALMVDPGDVRPVRAVGTRTMSLGPLRPPAPAPSGA